MRTLLALLLLVGGTIAADAQQRRQSVQCQDIHGNTYPNVTMCYEGARYIAQYQTQCTTRECVTEAYRRSYVVCTKTCL